MADFNGAYRGRRVFLTGHTGFKGSWMALWLHGLGANVTGYAHRPPPPPSLFELARVGKTLINIEADVRDAARLRDELIAARPDIVFHFAAQALVLAGYERPLETLETNVMGTANLLEAVRAYSHGGRPCAVVIVTSDKCYENQEWVHGYRETDPMGGHDPYSMSKGSAELVVAAWRRSYFPVDGMAQHGVGVATVRAGNVIGGGDWTRDRIVVDCVRALLSGEAIQVRNPHATRPWQHVLEPLSGYLQLGARLMAEDRVLAGNFAEAWNFGPSASGVWPVGQLVDHLIRLWSAGRWEDRSDPTARHEAKLLAVSIDKAYHRLGWRPVWNVERALDKTVEWFKAYASRPFDAREVTQRQIDEYAADRCCSN